jgi:hypothetical protein
VLVEEAHITIRAWILDERCSPLLDVTVLEMSLFLSIIVQMDHDQRDRTKHYSFTLEQFSTDFYGKETK